MIIQSRWQRLIDQQLLVHRDKESLIVVGGLFVNQECLIGLGEIPEDPETDPCNYNEAI